MKKSDLEGLDAVQGSAQAAVNVPTLPRSSSTFRVGMYGVLLASDWLAILFGIMASFAIHPSMQQMSSLMLLYAVLPLYTVLALLTDAYDRETMLSIEEAWSRCSTAFFIAAFLMLLMASPFKFQPEPPASLFFYGVAIGYCTLIAARALIALVVKTKFRSAVLSSVYIIDESIEFSAPKGFVAVECRAAALAPDIDDPIMLHRLASLFKGVDQILVACPPQRRAAWAIVLKGLGVEGGLLVPEFRPLGIQNAPMAPNLPVLVVSVGPLSLRNRVAKRLFDLAVTIPLLVLLLPPMLVTALLIKLDSPGPVLFKQQRIGRGNHLFNIYKFRSMRVEQADSDGTRSATRDDNRITRFGSFIRKTSIDELPQLINVLLGDMSLVGPRPHALGSRAQDQLFWQIDSRYFIRHAVKPGITGIAQVRGYRGATHKTEDLTDRLQADLEYLSRWSVWFDISIMLRTVLVVFHKNAY